MENNDFTDDHYFRIKNRSNETINLFLADNHLFSSLNPLDAFSDDGKKIKELKDGKGIAIHEYIAQERLTARDLDLVLGKKYIITNQTARRIGIKNYSQTEELIFPPFGAREVSGEFLQSFDFLHWKNQSLVKIDSVVEQKTNDTALAISGIGVVLFILFLAVSIPLAIFVPHSISWLAIGLVSAVFVVILLVSIYFSKQVTNVGNLGETLGNWLSLTPGIALVLLVGVGLPFGAVYFFGGGRELFVLADGNLVTLGRLMQMTFIAVASILPALLYYLFGRLQVEKQRTTFFREALKLDPNIQSISEAASKYDPLLDTVFGNGNSPFAILLLVITTGLLVMGWVVTLEPVGQVTGTVTSLVPFFTPHPTPFTLGFLGAYFFAINMVFRRYVRLDLTPKTYAYIIVRLLITLVLVWAISTLPEFANTEAQAANGGSVLGNTILVAVAFIVGIFPDTGLALISDFTRRATRNLIKMDKEEPFPLSDLEGMNLYDRARLLEEGIENIENLAHHDLMELIARTRIPTTRLVDMFDQALLYIHMGIDHEKDDDQPATPTPNQGQALWAKLKSYGIRTASGLVHAIERPATNENSLAQVVAKDEGEASRLKLIVDAVKQENWLDDILNWYELLKVTEPVTDPHVFYKMKPPLTRSAEGAEENEKGLEVQPDSLTQPALEKLEVAPQSAMR